MALVRVTSHRARSKLLRVCDASRRFFLAKGEFYEISDAFLSRAVEITGVSRVKNGDPDAARDKRETRWLARMTEDVRGLVNKLGGGEVERGFEIETRYGTLTIHPYDTWIATRFTDPTRLKGVYGACDYTGKWNFLAETRTEQSVRDLFDHFASELAQIAVPKA